jgi:D-arabinose 1-dehydrogenase-like Zn-dependent alcohol dehydrogenase
MAGRAVRIVAVTQTGGLTIGGGARQQREHPRSSTGETLLRATAALRPGGRLVSVAEEPPNGGTYYLVEPSRSQLDELARLADAGELVPAIDSVYPLEEAQAAFARSLARGKRGKVVLQIR